MHAGSFGALGMRIEVDRLRDLLEGAFCAAGLNAEDGKIVADVLVEAELRGRSTHGALRARGIVERIRSSPGDPLTIDRRGPSFALVDGRGALGYLGANRCATLASEMCRASGVAVVGGRGFSPCGYLGYYASKIALEGHAAIMMCNTSPRVVPWGGDTPVFGTNPIAAAFPGRDHPILIDLSTAAVTNGVIMMAIASGSELPEGVALGPNGEPTTDPARAKAGAVLPFGGHKGYALSLMVQLFSAVLMGAAPVPEPMQDYGIFALAIDPAAFSDPDETTARTNALLDAVTAAGDVLIPGERAFRSRASLLTSGIEIDDEVMEALIRMGDGQS